MTFLGWLGLFCIAILMVAFVDVSFVKREGRFSRSAVNDLEKLVEYYENGGRLKLDKDNEVKLRNYYLKTRGKVLLRK